MVWSSRTSWPALKPAARATSTDVAPRAARAARSTEPASSIHRCPTTITGACAFSLVRRSQVAPGPAPRSTTPLWRVIGCSPLTRKSPAESRTTWPDGQASMAVWMPLVASALPFPQSAAARVAQTVVRAGMPPGMPGLHAMRRSAGMTPAAPAAFAPSTAAGVETAAGAPVASARHAGERRQRGEDRARRRRRFARSVSCMGTGESGHRGAGSTDASRLQTMCRARRRPAHARRVPRSGFPRCDFPRRPDGAQAPRSYVCSTGAPLRPTRNARTP